MLGGDINIRAGSRGLNDNDLGFKGEGLRRGKIGDPVLPDCVWSL